MTTEMREVIKENRVAVTVILTIAATALAVGLLALHPAHSGQASPRLAALPEPDCAPPPLARESYARSGYRQRAPASAFAADPTETPQRRIPMHLTVHEGDGEKMGRIVACDAIAHGAQVAHRPRHGYDIDYDDRWQPRLDELNPRALTGDREEAAEMWWETEHQYVISAGYADWAAGAATETAERSMARSAPAPERRIRLAVLELPTGAFPDRDVKFIGGTLVAGGVAMPLLLGIALAMFWWSAADARRQFP